MERELIIERTRAGLDVACQLGGKGAQAKDDDRKIESAKNLLGPTVFRPRTWPRTLRLSFFVMKRMRHDNEHELPAAHKPFQDRSGRSYFFFDFTRGLNYGFPSTCGAAYRNGGSANRAYSDLDRPSQA
jgi:hypothetical protein